MRGAVALLAGSFLLVSGARSAQAQSADTGWFDDSSAAAPVAAPAAPRVPATPRAPATPGEPLAPSPLLQNDAPAAQAQDQTSPEDRDPRALTAWNAYVDPYGTWVEDPRYGRVWVPNANIVGSDFAPYSTGGRWALDENSQWTWVSDYPFGWVTFHYGRWVWTAAGWAWVPGLTYAPAWVAWRAPVGSYAYVGWAPLPPSYVWFGGFSVWYPYYPIYPWVFCPSEYVFHSHVHAYIVHDHYGMTYAAHYTRPYYPASVHPGAAPHGPSPQMARVPSSLVPHERVSSQSITPHGAGVSSAQGYQRSQAFQRAGVDSGMLRQSPMLRPSTLSSSRAQPYSQGSAFYRRDASSRISSSSSFHTSSVERVRSVPQHDFSPRMQSSPSMQPMHTSSGGSFMHTGGGFSHSGGSFSHSGGSFSHGGGRR